MITNAPAPRATADRPHPPASNGRPPAKPLQPAPAKFGTAGISAGAAHHVKESITPSSSYSRTPGPVQLAQGLGWFSIGLGVAELLGGRSMARWMGAPEQEVLLRAYGVREIATGVGILATSDIKTRQRWVQGRVVGDAMDLTTLGVAMLRPDAHHARIGGALAAVAAVTVLDVLCVALLSDG